MSTASTNASSRGGPDRAENASGPPSRRRPHRVRARLTPHRVSVVVLVVGLTLSLGVAAGTAMAVRANENQLLRQELRQVSASLEAAIPSIQGPLISAARVATSNNSLDGFKSFVESEVGGQAPFRSVSLWTNTRQGPRMLAVVGERPQILTRPSDAHRFFSSVRPSARLTVTGNLSGPSRSLGFAEMLPGTTNGRFVYAENALPSHSPTTYPRDSPFYGLNFALYLGSRPRAGSLMESSATWPLNGTHLTSVTSFANSTVTIVALPPSHRSALLRYPLPWMLGALGLTLTATAALTNERLARRSENAESLAEDTERRYDTQRDISETLQRALLPTVMPRVQELEVATRYVSGVQSLDVGGDWYDAIAVDDDHLFVTVGDVAGRGLQAASKMAFLRHAIRAYAAQGDEPATVLTRLDNLVDVGSDGVFATVLCALIDVPQRRVTMASAGHPPPLLIDDTGCRFLPVPVSTPIGVKGPAAQPSWSTSFGPRSIFIAYTDGLVERRGQDLDESLEKLRQTAQSHVGPIDEMLHAILGELVPEGSADDVAMLGVQWPESSSSDVVRRFACVPASIGAARRFVDHTLPMGSPEDHDVVAILVSEIVTNVLLHAKTELEIAVSYLDEGHRIHVEVADQSAGDPVARAADPSQPHGRGLQIVESLAESWGVEWSANGSSKIVWFEYRLGRDHNRDE